MYTSKKAKGGRPTFGEQAKVKMTITIDPVLVSMIRGYQGKRPNVSGFLEDAAINELDRLTRRGPNRGPKAKKLGKI